MILHEKIIMFELCGLFFVVLVSCALTDAQGTTRLITKNGKQIDCPHTEVINIAENEEVRIEMKHTHVINHALIQFPGKLEQEISDTHQIKTAMVTVTPRYSGIWKLRTLTNKDTTGVTVTPPTEIILYENTTYYAYICNFNIQVQNKTESEGQNKIQNKTESEGQNKIPVSTWIIIAGSVAAVIILIQAGYIIYILKVKRVRRIDQLLNKAGQGNDTARYSCTPSRKASQKAKDEDSGSIYETLDIQTPDDSAPLPPPIETLPRPKKPSGNLISTPTKAPAISEENVQRRAPMPLPGGTQVPDTSRSPGKVKLPPFTATSSTSSDRNTMRKPSAIAQGPLSAELNNILKKRQTGNMGGLPQKAVEIPDSLPEAPVPGSQCLKPSVLAKFNNAPSPTNQPHASRPIVPKKQPIPPQAHHMSPHTPQMSPHAHQIPPQPHQMPPPTHQMSPHAHQLPLQGHPISKLQSGLPQHLRQQQQGMRSPMPILPSASEEDVTYAEYDDSDEWTYEPLEPMNKYDYNIYSS